MDEFPEKDACELLDADHIAVKHLFVEYARLAYGAMQETLNERTQLAMRICDELTVHAQIEEEIFYPGLRKAAPDMAGKLDEANEEHAQAKAMIAQIQALGTAGPQMDELVAQLACAIDHHVKEERDELFPKAKATMDLGAVGDQLRERQHALVAAMA